MLEMDYSDDTGKNWMVNLEKIYKGELDLSTYVGIASAIASLTLLRSPKAVGGVMSSIISKLKVMLKGQNKGKNNPAQITRKGIDFMNNVKNKGGKW
jgi:hypothetical protein